MPLDPAQRARRETLVKAHIEAENRHDAMATVATFAQPKYDVVPFGQVLEGPQAVHDLLAGLFAAFPDFQARALATHHADEAVVVEIEMTGTQRGEWAGLPPQGGSMRLPTCAIFVFEGDRLVCEKVYFDFAALQKQLGH